MADHTEEFTPLYKALHTIENACITIRQELRRLSYLEGGEAPDAGPVPIGRVDLTSLPPPPAGAVPVDTTPPPVTRWVCRWEEGRGGRVRAIVVHASTAREASLIAAALMGINRFDIEVEEAPDHWLGATIILGDK